MIIAANAPDDGTHPRPNEPSDAARRVLAERRATTGARRGPRRRGRRCGTALDLLPVVYGPSGTRRRLLELLHRALTARKRTLILVPRADQQLVVDIREALAVAADPAKAGPMQAYMKSAMPFRGVQKPARVTALRPVFHRHVLPDRESWDATVRALWDRAEFREERYAAIDLARHGAYAGWATDERSMDLYDHLITTGAWWDYVDDVAIHLVGPTLMAHRAAITPLILCWAHDADRWRRRSAVICQVGARDHTDTALLTACIRDNAGEADFFLRKGIGWALREHAKTNPDWVRSFVATHRDRLSSLSMREATRHI